MRDTDERKKRIKQVTVTGALAAVAMVLAYVELLLPPIYAPLPAIKCGLANIAVLFTLYKCGKLSAALVSAVKVLLTALLFGTFTSLAYSACGAILSLAVMIPLKRWNKFSPIGVSVAGAVAHNTGQIIAAVIITSTPAVALYFPVLLFTGAVAGIIVGLSGGALIMCVKKI